MLWTTIVLFGAVLLIVVSAITSSMVGTTSRRVQEIERAKTNSWYTGSNDIDQ